VRAPDHDTTPPAVEPPAARFEGVASLVASQGFAPSTSAGLVLGGDVRWSWLSLGVEGRVDAPSGVTGAAGGSVSSWLTLGALVPCGYVGTFFACAIAQGGVMEASGAGVVDHRAVSLAWLSAGGRVGVLIPLGASLLLRLHGDVVACLDKATLQLDGTGVWTTPAVAGTLGAGVLVRF
jgi:hypothetical protein